MTLEDLVNGGNSQDLSWSTSWVIEDLLVVRAIQVRYFLMNDRGMDLIISLEILILLIWYMSLADPGGGGGVGVREGVGGIAFAHSFKLDFHSTF